MVKWTTEARVSTKEEYLMLPYQQAQVPVLCPAELTGSHGGSGDFSCLNVVLNPGKTTGDTPL